MHELVMKLLTHCYQADLVYDSRKGLFALNVSKGMENCNKCDPPHWF